MTAEILQRLGSNYEVVGIDEDLWQLRRRKDPDELVLMRKAIACTESMYERARQIIEPGIPNASRTASRSGSARCQQPAPDSGSAGPWQRRLSCWSGRWRLC